jgi:predicted glycosyltransferase
MPKTIVHLITEDSYPSHGGMQSAVARIARIISQLEDTSAEICALSTRCDSSYIPDLKAPLTSLFADKQAIADPLYNAIDGRFTGAAGATHSAREERFRLAYLQILRHVQDQLRRAPDADHILLSFFVTETGFVAQQVAAREHLTHIASIRGSDYSRGFFSPDTIGGVEYVLRRADYIVATNHEQRRAIEYMFGIRDKVGVIYNSLPQHPALWKPKRRSYVQLFSDTGYSYKKGTHILLQSFKDLRGRGLNLKLCIVGSTKDSECAFWGRIKKELQDLFPSDLTLLDYQAVGEIDHYLGDADIYCSATLGEGCSQGRTRALLTGMPVVTTLCGEVADIHERLTHCFTARCGDMAGYASALQAAYSTVCNTEQIVVPSVHEDVVTRFTEEEERRQWKEVICKNTAHKRLSQCSSEEFRVLFYVHDGRGLGHLRRVATVASYMQQRCSTLVVCGHREGALVLDEDCEFVHIPTLERTDSNHLGYNRQAFPGKSPDLALRVRKAVIQTTVNAFQPDAIVVDYLPFGSYNEMLDVLRSARCRRYLILRGIVDDKPSARRKIFLDADSIAEVYERVFVACDPCIIDLAAEYELAPSLSNKLLYTGYVSVPDRVREAPRYRAQRGISAGVKWVVCSAGGGRKSDVFFEACAALARGMPDVRFDIVTGPRFETGDSFISSNAENLTVWKERKDLPYWHAACDLVITHGGYNTVIEAISAGTPTLVFPFDGNVERLTHAKRLGSFENVVVITEPSELNSHVRKMLEDCRRRRPVLSMAGAKAISKCIISDLNQPNPRPRGS